MKYLGPSNLPQQHLPSYNCWSAFSSYDNNNNTLNENSSPEPFSNFVKTNNNIGATRQPFSCLTNNNLVLEKSFEHQNIRKCPSSKEFQTEMELIKYRERRSKNNEAAKHSRTKRREREQLLQQRVMELERENSRLRNELEEEKRKFGRNE
uniref:BZIP domain-containing protein n=1 Tax=Meloidogyne hapla TaxID=6305 RepID=A0A1I8B9L6_MELHA